MEAKHTPGPWELIERSERYTDETFTAITHVTNRNKPGKHSEQDVCHVCEWGAPCDESRANARLIAAAPELLEALQNALNVMVNTYFTHHAHEFAL